METIFLTIATDLLVRIFFTLTIFFLLLLVGYLTGNIAIEAAAGIWLLINATVLVVAQFEVTAILYYLIGLAVIFQAIINYQEETKHETTI